MVTMAEMYSKIMQLVTNNMQSNKRSTPLTAMIRDAHGNIMR